MALDKCTLVKMYVESDRKSNRSIKGLAKWCFQLHSYIIIHHSCHTSTTHNLIIHPQSIPTWCSVPSNGTRFSTRHTWADDGWRQLITRYLPLFINRFLIFSMTCSLVRSGLRALELSLGSVYCKKLALRKTLTAFFSFLFYQQYVSPRSHPLQKSFCKVDWCRFWCYVHISLLDSGVGWEKRTGTRLKFCSLIWVWWGQWGSDQWLGWELIKKRLLEDLLEEWEHMKLVIVDSSAKGADVWSWNKGETSFITILEELLTLGVGCSKGWGMGCAVMTDLFRSVYLIGTSDSSFQRTSSGISQVWLEFLITAHQPRGGAVYCVDKEGWMC